jgi:Na+/alanine symporter
MRRTLFYKKNYKVIIAFTSIISWVALGTFCYKILEEWSVIDCFYFSVTTLSTVGYGELAPSSDLSKLFTSFYILGGVTTVLSCLNLIGNKTLQRQTEQLKKNSKFIEEKLNLDM